MHFLPWVVKNTIIDDKPRVKARLYACGFEEEEQNYRTESPTCSREGIRVITLTSSIALTSSKKWAINSIGIKRALLHYNVKSVQILSYFRSVFSCIWTE